MTDKCMKCDGCGQIADSEDEEPWSAWLSLPLGSSLAVLTGIVKPKTCPKCNGTGLLPAHHATPQAGEQEKP